MNQPCYLPEERAMFALRSLYRGYGYLPFRMNKFEEYDLYATNKDFLVSDGIITFTDRSGRLLALKPDVTLSIVKNYTFCAGCAEKVYYDERVYRPSGSTHEYKEILQSGLECIGDLDFSQVAEVVVLAVRSMRELGGSGRYVLALSHLGILSALLEQCGADERMRRDIVECIGAKNAHELRRICEQGGIENAMCDKLEALISIHGDLGAALASLKTLLGTHPAYLAGLEELEQLCGVLKELSLCEGVHLDFSITADMRYYSGIVFRGYLEGIPERVLSGGRYDRLVTHLGKQGGAVGFAVYLDLLEQTVEEAAYDADVLLLYDKDIDPTSVLRAVEDYSKKGLRVMAQHAVPEKMTFARTVRMEQGGAFIEDHD